MNKAAKEVFPLDFCKNCPIISLDFCDFWGIISFL